MEKERNICGKKEHYNKGLYARTGGADTWDAPRSLKEILSKLQNDETFKSVDADTVRLLNACTNNNISINEGEEKVDMFLTTFDKKMYREALREEVREELEEEKRLLEEENATLAQQIVEKTQQIDEQARMLTEQTKQLEVERRRVAELEALLANKSE